MPCGELDGNSEECIRQDRPRTVIYSASWSSTQQPLAASAVASLNERALYATAVADWLLNRNLTRRVRKSCPKLNKCCMYLFKDPRDGSFPCKVLCRGAFGPGLAPVSATDEGACGFNTAVVVGFGETFLQAVRGASAVSTPTTSFSCYIYAILFIHMHKYIYICIYIYTYMHMEVHGASLEQPLLSGLPLTRQSHRQEIRSLGC